jgi:DNA-directed RNA polymerase subunit H (RpoH/RPB5)
MRCNKLGALSNEELEQLIDYMATKAADLAVIKMEDQIYKSLGRKLFDKILWIVGAISLGFIIYLNKNGISIFK